MKNGTICDKHSCEKTEYKNANGTSQFTCKECKREYYQSNKTKILKSKKKYRQENPNLLQERDKQFYIDHKEEKLEYRHNYYQENKEQVKQDSVDREYSKSIEKLTLKKLSHTTKSMVKFIVQIIKKRFERKHVSMRKLVGKTILLSD
jgi:hypothetical protein